MRRKKTYAFYGQGLYRNRRRFGNRAGGLRAFAADGGKVAVVDLNEEHGREAVEAITSAGGEAIFAKANVGDSAEVQAAIKATVDK